jgi:hypothetical protein
MSKMDISETDLIFMKHNAEETRVIRAKFRNGTFFDKENQFYIDDLFDESKLPEEKCPRKHIRIGPEYQATLPPNESLSHKLQKLKIDQS